MNSRTTDCWATGFLVFITLPLLKFVIIYSIIQIVSLDIDECALGTDICDTNAACTNTVGSFTCACNNGYSGDGVTCTGNLFDIFYFHFFSGDSKCFSHTNNLMCRESTRAHASFMSTSMHLCFNSNTGFASDI